MTHNINTEKEHQHLIPAALITGLERYLAAPGDASSQFLDSYTDLAHEEQQALVVYLLYANATSALTPSLIEGCGDAHIGTYPSWQHARQELAANLGWQSMLASADFEDAVGCAIADLLTWNENAVRDRLHTLFHIVHLDDGTVYVFYKEPHDEPA